MILKFYIVQATTILFFLFGGKLYKNIRAGVQPLACKHTCDVDMRRAYAIGVLDRIEDRLKVHMYWLNVQGFRVCCLLFIVCCLLFNVCCLGHSCRSTIDKQKQLTSTCDVDMRTIILQPKGHH